MRGVWLWLRDQGLKFPLQPGAYIRGSEIIWTEPTYHAVHNVLTHPAYAGAYTFGRSRQQRLARDDGTLRVRRRVLPQDQWEVLIKDHHEGFIDWDTYQANQDKIGQNMRPAAHQPGTGAVREGCALLQGLATCGTCGRKLAVYYEGKHKATPGYYCTGTGNMVDGRGTRHLRVGGVAIDAAVTAAFLAALEPVAPASLPASRPAARARPRRRPGAAPAPGRAGPLPRGQGRTPLPGGRPGQPAGRPRPGSRLGESAHRAGRRRGRARPPPGSPPRSADQRRTRRHPRPRRRPAAVWDAPSTTDKDRKQLLRTLLEEVNITIRRDHDSGHADLVLRWKGGAITELAIPVKRKPPRRLRTDEDTVTWSAAWPSTTPTPRSPGSSTGSTAAPPAECHSPPVESRACGTTGTSPATRQAPTRRKENCSPWPTPPPNSAWPPPPCTAGSTTGSSAASSSPPAAPWRIRLTPEIRALFVDDAPDGWLAMLEATLAYGVSRQTIMQRVKDGRLRAVHVRTGRRKGLRIEPPQAPGRAVLTTTINKRSSVTMHPRTSGCPNRLIPVGTALAGGPPDRSQRAELPHWAPALGTGVEPDVRPRMRDPGSREPSRFESAHPLPGQAVALAPAPKRPAP